MPAPILIALAAAQAPATQAPVTTPPPAPQAAPAPAGSLGFLTAGQLIDRCNEAAQTSASFCFAYIAAVHDLARAYEVWLKQREFCLPAGAAQADLRRSFLNYAAARPEVRSGQAASAVLVALKVSYPCPIVSR